MLKKKTKGEKVSKLNNKRVQIFLLILLLLPVLSLFASIGKRFSKVEDDSLNVETPPTDNEEPSEPENPPSEPECSHVDADDNGVCDSCGTEYSDGEDVVEPEEPDVSEPTEDISSGTETPIVEVEPDGEWVFN